MTWLGLRVGPHANVSRGYIVMWLIFAFFVGALSGAACVAGLWNV